MSQKPKFKVGDRVFRKEHPELIRTIIGMKAISSNCLYETNLYEYGQPSKLCVEFNIDWMDEHYTLDLNHYIKNL